MKEKTQKFWLIVLLFFASWLFGITVGNESKIKFEYFYLIPITLWITLFISFIRYSQSKFNADLNI